ncbi:MAG TPA: SDR family oxidoreductase [Thermoanaerobaculia bacterium]|jgi:NAD(P)-dependent dehydrogenase (short-subunit alcohol dehydrogenase family)|nr:SDR family oxidoreductase [Thermoanaerobaculia bacterium]
MKSLAHKALVTGGAVRLGRAIALALGRAGCDVAVHHRHSTRAAEEVTAEIAALGRRSVALAADLSDARACAPLVEEARRALGGLDVLVNNAAIFLPGDLASTSLADWDAQLALNLRAPFLLAQAFAGGLGPEERGAIVNVSDARARRVGSGHLAYRVTKHALDHLTELLALELAPRVRVNAVAPGAMLAPGGDETALARRVAAAIPLRRAGGAEPVAEAVLYLLRAEFTTGVVLPVDGGEYL